MVTSTQPPKFTQPPQAVLGPMPRFQTAVLNKYLKQQDSARMVSIFGGMDRVSMQAT